MSYCPECQTNSQIVCSSPDIFNPRCSNCFSVLDFPQATTPEALQNLEKQAFDAAQHEFFNTYERPASEQNKFEKISFISYVKISFISYFRRVVDFLTPIYWGIVMIGFGLLLPLVSQLDNEVFKGHESSVNLVIVLIKLSLIISGIVKCRRPFDEGKRYKQDQENFKRVSKLVYSHAAYKDLKKIPSLAKKHYNDDAKNFYQRVKLDTALELTGIFNFGSLLALLIIGNNILSNPVAMILAGIAFIGFSISIVQLVAFMVYSYNGSDSLEDIAGSMLCTSIGIISLILSIVVLYHQRFGEIIVSFFR